MDNVALPDVVSKRWRAADFSQHRLYTLMLRACLVMRLCIWKRGTVNRFWPNPKLSLDTPEVDWGMEEPNQPSWCAGMNLFRSEQHARSWHKRSEELCWTHHPAAWGVETFSRPISRNRARLGFVSWLGGGGAEAVTQLSARVSE